jgi:acyl transferase domain-containing protein
MIGDPIELRALSRAFGKQTSARQFCAIGSVKTNLGHLHSAAGIASFIKMVLALRHGFIPPTLNCETPNPRFDFANSPFYPPTGLRAWEPRGGPRRAGVSSFGFGGTNCHVLLEEFSIERFPGFLPRRKSLPPVQFDRKRYWPDAPKTKNPDMEPETIFAADESESFLVLEEVLGS